MKELTDLEICTHIAEIEGIKVFMYSHIVFGDILCREMSSLNLAPQPYNPLTDDALCFELVKKHNVEIIPQWDRVSSNNGVTCIHGYTDNPNKAICLAIIQAHE